MGKSQRDKGARGEREVAAMLTELGFPAERAARNGVKGAGDIVCDSLPDLHIEVKDYELMRLGSAAWENAWHQAATTAAQRGRYAVLFWRCGRGTFALTWIDEHKRLATVVHGSGIKDVLTGMRQATL